MAEEIELFNKALTQYAAGPDLLEAALSGLSEADLDLAADHDCWTIRQIVHHIADGDELWKFCIKAALGNPQGPFSLEWYWDRPQVDWASDWAYDRLSIATSLQLLRTSRRQIVELLQQSPQAWQKSIQVKWPHRTAEQVTIGYVLEMQAAHVGGHIEDIQMIRRVCQI